jgi:hypothetical protein
VSIKEASSKLILDIDRVQLNGSTLKLQMCMHPYSGALLKKPTILMFAKKSKNNPYLGFFQTINVSHKTSLSEKKFWTISPVECALPNLWAGHIW